MAHSSIGHAWSVTPDCHATYATNGAMAVIRRRQRGEWDLVIAGTLHHSGTLRACQRALADYERAIEQRVWAVIDTRVTVEGTEGELVIELFETEAVARLYLKRCGGAKFGHVQPMKIRRVLTGLI